VRPSLTLARHQLDNERPVQTFPDKYSIKAVGKTSEDFAEYVAAVVREIAVDGPVTWRTRDSRAGAYLSVTLSFTATSQQQLDEVFRTVSELERVVWVL